MSRLFVTGGSGFIGTNLVQFLVDRGCEVLNFDCKVPLNSHHGKYHHRGELLDPVALQSAMRSFQTWSFTSPLAVTLMALRTQSMRPTPSASGTSSRPSKVPDQLSEWSLLPLDMYIRLQHNLNEMMSTLPSRIMAQVKQKARGLCAPVGWECLGS
jgi:hypothetical protein